MISIVDLDQMAYSSNCAASNPIPPSIYFEEIGEALM
jgi:hypothetical protein